MMINFVGLMNNFILFLLVFIILGFILSGIFINFNVLGGVIKDLVVVKVGLVSGDKIIRVVMIKVSIWNDIF